jgi:hypothetical protein
MVFPKGRFAALALTGLLALPPSMALAQCQHGGSGMSGMPHMGMGMGTGMGMGRPMGGMMMSQMSSMSSMSSMCSMHQQMSRMSMTSFQQTPSMQWFGLQQGQQLHLQQMQSLALQQMMMQRQMQLLSMQQQPPPGLIQSLPPTGPADFTTQQPRLKPSEKKQYGDLQKAMDALQQQLTGLQQASERNELQAPQVSGAQNDLVALQSRLDALSKPPAALTDEMNSLQRQTDELLDQVTAKPDKLIASVRTKR